MGTTGKVVVASAASVTTAYASGLETGELDVAGSDSITLLLTGITTLGTLTMKFQERGLDLMKVDGGSTVLDELVHQTSKGASVAIRLDVRTLSELNILFKGDVSGTISEIAVQYEGTQTTTPNIRGAA